MVTLTEFHVPIIQAVQDMEWMVTNPEAMVFMFMESGIFYSNGNGMMYNDFQIIGYCMIHSIPFATVLVHRSSPQKDRNIYTLLPK